MPIPLEPTAKRDLALLVDYVEVRVRKLIAAMEDLGFDPVIFETLRTPERQEWLYGIGRTHDRNRRPVTWTLDSKHISGKAVDFVSRSRGWSWPAFYDALAEEAKRVGMHTLTAERCHVEWRG